MWMPGVERVPTQAFGYGGVSRIAPIAVMSHIMQGYQQTMINWAKERPFITPKSAHFTIGRDGRIVQHVAIDQPAWAAGYVRDPSWLLLPPDTNPNLLVVHIEHEGFSVPPGYGYDYVYSGAMPWPKPMVDASIRVHKWVMESLNIVPSENTVIGHFMVDSATRANDPGADWPRQRILSELVSGDLPAPLSRVEAALAAYRNGVRPVRQSGPYSYYELRIQR